MISRVSLSFSRNCLNSLKITAALSSYKYFDFRTQSHSRRVQINSLMFKSNYYMAKQSKKEKQKNKDKQQKKKIKQQLGDTSEFDLNKYEQKYDQILEGFKQKISYFKVGRLDQTYFLNTYARVGNKNQSVQSLAEIAPRSANVVVFNPYDSDNLDSIEKALQASDLGLEVTKSDKTLVVTQPPNTMNDLKKRFIQKLKKQTNTTKQKFNSIRNQARNQAKKFKKIAMQDRIRQIQAQIKNQNDTYTSKLEKLANSKEKQLGK